MPLPTAPINYDAIKAEAEKAEFMHDDIKEAVLTECRYPIGSLAHKLFVNAFNRARQIRSYGSAQA